MAEVVLSGLVVRAQGTLIRPALLYMLPVGRSILLFGERGGIIVSLLVWLAYGINIVPDCLACQPWRLSQLLLVLSDALRGRVTLSLAIVRQERTRQRMQKLYDELRLAYSELHGTHQQVRGAAVAQERNRLAPEFHQGSPRPAIWRECVARSGAFLVTGAMTLAPTG